MEVDLTIDTMNLAEFAPALIGLARLFGMVTLAPGWSAVGLGWRSRLVIALVLAPVVLPFAWSDPARLVLEPPRDALAWLGALGTELLVGVLIGLGAVLVVAAARQAGDLVALLAGLTPQGAGMGDSEVGAGEGGVSDSTTPLGQLHGLLALCVFAVLDGPLALVSAVARSYDVVPLGGGKAPGGAYASISLVTVQWLGERLGLALELVLQVAAPPALAITLAGLAIGFLHRAAPSLSILPLTLPARFGLGMAALVMSLVMVVNLLAAAWMGDGRRGGAIAAFGAPPRNSDAAKPTPTQAVPHDSVGL